MTATAFAIAPELDRFDEENFTSRPQLRLIQGHVPAHAPTLLVPPTGPMPSVEVYRRRRFFALVATSLLVLAIAWVAGISVVSFGAVASAADTSTQNAPVVHVVLPGDSYGSIASDLGVANPAEAAIQLQAANGGSDLVVGQRVVINLASFSAAG